jgi:hypothetical protein
MKSLFFEAETAVDMKKRGVEGVAEPGRLL